MEEVTNITENTVNRYFNSLSKLGYRNYTDVYKIIILTFLEELLDCDFFGFVSEEDYNAIMKAIYCLADNTCTIEFPSYATYDSIFRKFDVDLSPKITEDGIFRSSEWYNIKAKA